MTNVSWPTPSDLLKQVGWSATAANVQLAQAQLEAVFQFAKGYTRGVGFGDSDGVFITPDLKTVILSAASRALANPTNAYRLEVGSANVTPARFEGFTLAEQMILNKYRVRVN